MDSGKAANLTYNISAIAVDAIPVRGFFKAFFTFTCIHCIVRTYTLQVLTECFLRLRGQRHVGRLGFLGPARSSGCGRVGVGRRWLVHETISFEEARH